MSEIGDLDDMVQETFVKSRVNTTWRRGGVPSPLTAGLAREALRLRRQGLTFREVGSRLGVSDVYASLLVRKTQRQERKP